MSAAAGVLRLDADNDQLTTFLSALFRYADDGTFISFRGFDQYDRGKGPILIQARVLTAQGITAGLVQEAAVAANRVHARAGIFAPPVVTFLTNSRARHEDIANGLTISVDLDTAPLAGALFLRPF